MKTKQQISNTQNDKVKTTDKNNQTEKNRPQNPLTLESIDTLSEINTILENSTSVLLGSSFYTLVWPSIFTKWINTYNQRRHRWSTTKNEK